MSTTHEDLAQPNLDNLRTGLLSPAEEQTLLSEPDYGLTRPPLTRFPTYEDWGKRKGTASHNQMWFDGLPEDGEPDFSISTSARAFPSFQRLIVVRPDLIADIKKSMEEDEAEGLGGPKGPSPETDELLWQAYELMADLTDVHDEERVPGSLSQRQPVVDGQIDPNCLMI